MRELGTCPASARAKPIAIPALTGVRFVAAFLVLLAHSAETFMRFAAPDPSWHYFLSAAAYVGMSLFFVLSGFVIQYNYSEIMRSDPLRGTFNFFVARFARLYPMYFLILGLDLFRFGYFENLDNPSMTNVLVTGMPSYLLLAPTWHYRMIGDHTLIFSFPAATQVTWSVSTVVLPIRVHRSSQASKCQSNAVGVRGVGPGRICYIARYSRVWLGMR